MKIKQYRYYISDYMGSYDLDPYYQREHRKSQFAEKQIKAITIQNKMRRFINSHKEDIIDIRVIQSTLNRHNNGGLDVILETVTILYNK